MEWKRFMRRRAFHLSCVLGCFLACPGMFVPGYAQQGHPLSGTWSGDWGPPSGARTKVTIVMDWDGKKVTGIINPGPDSAPIANVSVDPSNWAIRIEADAKDAAGKSAHVVVDGRMTDIGSYHRVIAGTWHQGTVAGDFRLTRD